MFPHMSAMGTVLVLSSVHMSVLAKTEN